MTTLGGVLNLIEDTRVEPNENVQLTATIIAGTGGFTLNGDTATVVIQDNDCTKFATIITELDNIIVLLLLQSLQSDLIRPHTKSLRQWVKFKYASEWNRTMY